MASGISSPLGITGVLLIIIGIIMAVVGVILLIANQNKPKAWYIWLLLIGGVVLGIAGGIMLAIALSRGPAPECCLTQPVVPPATTTTSFITQGPPQHVMASGPYGPGGTTATVPGVLTPAPMKHYITSDISPHSVVAVNQ
jgi:hypothetical protein